MLKTRLIEYFVRYTRIVLVLAPRLETSIVNRLILITHEGICVLDQSPSVSDQLVGVREACITNRPLPAAWILVRISA